MAGRPVTRTARAQMRRPAQTGKNAFTRTARLAEKLSYDPVRILRAFNLPKVNESLALRHRESATIIRKLQKRFGTTLAKLPDKTLQAKLHRAAGISRESLFDAVTQNSERLTKILRR